MIIFDIDGAAIGGNREIDFDFGVEYNYGRGVKLFIFDSLRFLLYLTRTVVYQATSLHIVVLLWLTATDDPTRSIFLQVEYPRYQHFLGQCIQSVSTPPQQVSNQL